MNAELTPLFDNVTVLLGDPNLPDTSKPQQRFTPEDLDNIEQLKTALSAVNGYVFSYFTDHIRLLTELLATPPAFVLNCCDTGYRNQARLELHIAAYLEMLGIPYSGSGPVTLGACYDKALVRALAAAAGIPVPNEAYVNNDGPTTLPAMSYPVFIKPNSADGSVGISAQSLATNEFEAKRYLEQLRNKLGQIPLLMQEYLTGPEYSIALIGNPGQGFTALPLLEVDYSELDPTLPKILDYGSKTEPNSPYWTDVKYRPAKVDQTTLAQIKTYAETLFTRLGLRDYGRFDFRTDEQGIIKLLEVNPNPAWCWDGKLNLMAGFAGRSYSELLAMILNTAQARYR